jgi:uncharacterized protein (DUF58 family)
VPKKSGTGWLRNITERFRVRFRKWVNRRIPPARSIVLDQRRIFIFPSRVGFFFGLCLIVMLITGINYQNNMAFALTFLLATLFVVGILHTYANLSGLKIHAVHARPAFPGQQAEFEILLEKGSQRSYVALKTKWPGSTERVSNLVEHDSVRVKLHTAVEGRGWYSPGRLLLESTYPLGLLRCWTWLDLDLYALVYPRPLVSDYLTGLETDTPDGASRPIEGNDDFSGFRNYRRGDSLKQVHWKGLAKGQTLQSKQYTAYADSSTWLDWDKFPGIGIEQRLSHLCYWALELESKNEEYGLRLPGVLIEPDFGEKHRDRVLKELALFGVGEQRS